MKTQFVTDKKGRRIAVIIPIKEYENLMEELDDLACIRMYDQAIQERPEFLPAEKAFREVEKKRKRKAL